MPSALTAMARDRRPLRHSPGLSFGKLLGCGSGETFTVRDVDIHHWGVLACWESAEAAAEFELSPLVTRWNRRSYERLSVVLNPIASRGRWAGQAPFGDPTTSERPTGPVAAVTRARLAPRRAITFWRAVPAVVADLHASDGVALTIGIGEAPIGLQGTFSLWQSEAAMRAFAYGREPHAEAIRRTNKVGWYAEQLFARFAVASCIGTFHGRPPLGTSSNPAGSNPAGPNP